jgi:hypothetical protein
MTTMRWLSLSLFCIGTLGFAGDADAQKGKRKKKKPPVEEPAEEEAGEEAEEEAEAEEEGDAYEAKPDEAPAPGIAGYDRGFYIREAGDGVGHLRFNARVQSRFTFQSNEVGDDRANSHNFSIPIARFAMWGKAFTERVTFKTEIALGQGRVALKDFWMDYRVGKKQTRVRIGQFKKPFSRQQLNSDSRLEFVDRSIVDSYFDNGRDLGLEVHSGFMERASTEWAVGIFNGTGEGGVFEPEVVVDPMTMESEVVGGAFNNIPNKVRPAIVARVGHNANGIRGYSEADLEGGDLRYALGAASMTHFRLGGNTASSRAGADFVVKQEGFSATGGVYVDMQGPKVADVEYAALGGYVQTGYVMDGKYQPALRYALIAEKGGDSIQEISGVFSLYEFEHGLKWQTDIALLNTDVGGARTKDYRGRSQVQLSF